MNYTNTVEYAINHPTNSSGYALFTSILLNESYPSYYGVFPVYVLKSGYVNQSMEAWLSASKDTAITVSLVRTPPPLDLGVISIVVVPPVLLFLVSGLVVARRRRESVGGRSRQRREVVEAPSEERARVNALYSKNLGADVYASSKTITHQNETQTPVAVLGTCMICNMELKQGDLLVRCPYCGHEAHKVHMLEWLHVKDCCPVCHMHLDEKDLK
jgi:hypothetical protein